MPRKRATQTIDRPSTSVRRERRPQDTIDDAVAKGVAGRDDVAPELHAGFDLVQRALAEYDAGHDDAVRTLLQGIGLQSPFLEWKLFLRGLLAYHSGDDERARENWQRLDSSRLPAHLCAPMRAMIDVNFLRTQPADLRKKFFLKLLEMHGIGFAKAFQGLTELLHKPKLTSAFRKVESLVPALSLEHPDLSARLARCFEWAIIDHGEPGDVERLVEIFAYFVDESSIQRLIALSCENRGIWPDAHAAWQDLIKAITKAPERAAKGVHRSYFVAMIWARMGENALKHGSPDTAQQGPFFGLFGRPPPLKPGADKCFENAIRHNPDRIESHVALFNVLCEQVNDARACKVGERLLQRFPDHLPTLVALGEICHVAEYFAKATQYFDRALAVNPLDPSIRPGACRAGIHHALGLTLEGRFDEARARHEQALAQFDKYGTIVLCQWAIAEMKAKEPARADELIARCLARPNQRLACRFALAACAVRVKLAPKEKTRLAREFKESLNQAPNPAEVVELFVAVARYRGIFSKTYTGQKGHEKAVLDLLDGASFALFDESQFVRLCEAIRLINAQKLWFTCLTHGQRRFPGSIGIGLSLVDYYLNDRSRYPRLNLAKEQLDRLRKVIEQLPHGEVQQQYREALNARDNRLRELQPSIPAFFDSIFGDLDDDDEGW